MATLKMGSTTMFTESSGALTVNVSDPTITLGSNTTFSGDAGQKTAKAWIYWDGQPSGGSIKDSFNITSITDRDVGRWTITFDNDFPNNLYVGVGSAANRSADNSTTDGQCFNNQALGSVQISNAYGDALNQSYFDRDGMYAVFFGD